jgi:hypothetical protein
MYILAQPTKKYNFFSAYGTMVLEKSWKKCGVIADQEGEYRIIPSSSYIKIMLLLIQDLLGMLVLLILIIKT